jgi:hypothetical protein
VTIWLPGWAVIEGATGAELFAWLTKPEHPAFAIANNKTNKARSKRRTILSLWFLGPAVGPLEKSKENFAESCI